MNFHKLQTVENLPTERRKKGVCASALILECVHKTFSRLQTESWQKKIFNMTDVFSMIKWAPQLSI